MSKIKDLARQIVAEQTSKNTKTEELDDGSFIARFNMRPMEIVEYLDQWVIGQHDAKWTLATKVCSHLRSIKRELESGINPMDNEDRIKANMLLIGNTGVGKTYLLRKVAKILKIPFVKFDATKFSETGYVGRNVDEMVRDLFRAALQIVKADKANKDLDEDALENKAIELAQYGIIYVDEFDKIAQSRGTHGADVSRSGVQRGMLTLTEETDVSVHDTQNPFEAIKMAQMQAMGKKIPEPKVINTRNIIFVFSGVFHGLADIIKESKGKRGIGFGSEQIAEEDKNKLLKDLRPEHLVTFGMESELMGRIPVRVLLEDLTQGQLLEILTKENSPIVNFFVGVMDSYNIDAEISLGALEHIAEIAHKEKTGGRGLVAAFDETLQTYEGRLCDTGITSITFTKEMIDGTVNPKELVDELKFLMSEAVLPDNVDGVNSYKKDILSRYGARLNFTREARDTITALTQASDIPGQVCRRILEPVEGYMKCFTAHNLVDFEVDEEVIQDPMSMIRNAFMKNFRNMKISREHGYNKFKDEVKQETGIDIKFSADALYEIFIGSVDADITPYEFCGDVFIGYMNGFRMLKDKGVSTLKITGEAVKDPKKYLEENYPM